ncbi:MAG TPA: SDR family NAD(P)-dependent oxidoreductase [Thermoleophilaceae bacterium]|nr:SDR family NAD(P)-dependent oxidoreductase [Thermoleophilaceae bacterium]
MTGQRVLITGAARGIGAAVARRLAGRGARVAVAGLEPELLERVAAECGGGPWWECDVTDRDRVQEVVDAAAEALGGLDVVVANAGVAAQMTIVGGDVDVWDRTLAVNLQGVFNTLRAAGPHIAHPGGYALAVSSLAAAIHLPLMSPYCASKAAVEALADCLRVELRPTGARVGVAYFAELDTDMTSRGFATDASRYLTRGGRLTRVAPLEPAVADVVRGIERRSRWIVAPRWVRWVLPVQVIAQRFVELAIRPRVGKAMQIARDERPDLTTSQPR